jgi:hypothetical protein
MLAVVFAGTGLINSLYKFLLLIFKQMKKIFFLMLMLLMLSTASMNAQVRIGGIDDPNTSAILDLNATDATNAGTVGLALPRVELTSTGNKAPLNSHVAGMTVYNTKTTGDVTPGTYYNDGEKWTRVGSGSLITEVDGIIGNEVTNATSNGVLERAGSGTVAAPYTLGIANNGVTTARIIDRAVTGDKINQMSATSGQVLKYNGSTWAPANPENVAYIDGTATSDSFYAVVTVSWAANAATGYYSVPAEASSSTFTELIACESSLKPIYGGPGAVTMMTQNGDATYAKGEAWITRCLLRFWQ